MRERRALWRYPNAQTIVPYYAQTPAPISVIGWERGARLPNQSLADHLAHKPPCKCKKLNLPPRKHRNLKCIPIPKSYKRMLFHPLPRDSRLGNKPRHYNAHPTANPKISRYDITIKILAKEGKLDNLPRRQQRENKEKKIRKSIHKPEDYMASPQDAHSKYTLVRKALQEQSKNTAKNPPSLPPPPANPPTKAYQKPVHP